jgi:hypothetical protein
MPTATWSTTSSVRLKIRRGEGDPGKGPTTTDPGAKDVPSNDNPQGGKGKGKNKRLTKAERQKRLTDATTTAMLGLHEQLRELREE